MRNFEALALNRILLTNKVPDHEILGDFQENIVFLRPDLSDIREKLALAIESKPLDISAQFLERHSLWPRVEEIVRVLTLKSGRNLVLQNRLGISEGPEELIKDDGCTITPHPPEELLAKSRKFSISDFRKVLDQKQPTAVMALGTLFKWGRNFSVFILSYFLGRTPTIRAVSRSLESRCRIKNS
jgi:hypothetical protein